VYDADPVTHPDATLMSEVTYLDLIAKGLRVMDSTAATMCKDHQLPIVVFNITKPGNVVRAVRGERIGTLVQ
jgi:uridylate kinase